MKRIKTIQILSVLIALQLLAGCAPITKKETVFDIERRTSYEPDPAGEVTDVAGNCAVQNSATVRCSFNYKTTKQENEVEFVQQKKIISKKANVPLQIIYYGLGGGALGFGGAITVNASNVPKKNIPDDDYKFNRNTNYKIGIGSLALGATLTTIGIIGSARAKDTVEALPPQSNIISSREVSGEQGTWAGKSVKVFAADTIVYEGKTDDSGQVSFDMDSFFPKSLPLQHGVVTTLRVVVENAADTEISISEYKHHMCGVEAKKFGATSPVDEYRNYFELCNKDVSWLTANPAWTSAASLYGEKIDRECANASTKENFDSCEGMYEALRKQLPFELIKPEGQKRFITAHEKFKNSKSKKKGRKKRKRR